MGLETIVLFMVAVVITLLVFFFTRPKMKLSKEALKMEREMDAWMQFEPKVKWRPTIHGPFSTIFPDWYKHTERKVEILPTTDISTITEISKTMLEEAETFSYLRKGEFANYGDVKNDIKDAVSRKIEVKVLMAESKTALKRKKEIEGFGAVARLIPPINASNFRYFVNDRMFCYFIRIPRKRFYGFVGRDPRIISELKEMFEREFNYAMLRHFDSRRSKKSS